MDQSSSFNMFGNYTTYTETKRNERVTLSNLQSSSYNLEIKSPNNIRSNDQLTNEINNSWSNTAQDKCLPGMDMSEEQQQFSRMHPEQHNPLNYGKKIR